MSRSPHFFVERYNIYRKKYELQHPVVWNWNHTKQIAANLFPYDGCHDLFSIVEDDNAGNDFPHMKGIHKGLPEGVSEEIQKEYEDCCYDISSNDDEEKRIYSPKVRWFTYADMYIYCLENPIATDYEAMDEAYFKAEKGEKVEQITMPTPMKVLKDRIDAFLEVMDIWNWQDDYSLIRIVYWIE